MDYRKELIEAVAQAWCTKENEKKIMDPDLAMAIVDKVMPLISKAKQEMVEELVNKTLARLAIEVMEMEIQKCDENYCQGHIHGVKRAIYLVKDLFVPEVTAKTFRIYPHQEDSLKEANPRETEK